MYYCDNAAADSGNDADEQFQSEASDGISETGVGK